jgi:hypothetical protein
MRNMNSGLLQAASLAVVLAASALVGSTPAMANPAQDKVISTYCDNATDSQECNDWRYNRASWSAEQYQTFYTQHQSDPSFQSAEAQAAFGLSVNTTASTTEVDPGTAPVRDTIGAAGSAVSVSPSSNEPTGAGSVSSTPTGNVVNTMPEVIGDSPTHIQDCQATYKSYDPATDTYMGLSGERQKCKL